MCSVSVFLFVFSSINDAKTIFSRRFSALNQTKNQIKIKCVKIVFNEMKRNNIFFVPSSSSHSIFCVFFISSSIECCDVDTRAHFRFKLRTTMELCKCSFSWFYNVLRFRPFQQKKKIKRKIKCFFSAFRFFFVFSFSNVTKTS